MIVGVPRMRAKVRIKQANTQEIPDLLSYRLHAGWELGKLTGLWIGSVNSKPSVYFQD